MMSFGALPRTRILNGAPGRWSGRNGVFTGIQVYRVPNMAGIWAQEFWEWRLHALWAGLSVLALLAGTAAAYALQSWLPYLAGFVGFGLALAIGNGNRAAREIYSHAITLEAGLMCGIPVSVDEMIGSLKTYSYCRGMSEGDLRMKLFVARPKARAWCEEHRAQIERLTKV